MVRSTTYRGEHTFNKIVTREVPALVDTPIWEKANRQLTANIRLSTRKNDHQYLLRGLIACAGCGALYHGQMVSTTSGGNSWSGIYYRCGAQVGDRGAMATERCKAKAIRADWIEDLVWKDIKGFVTNPGQVLEKLQERIIEELATTPSTEERRQEIERALAQKETERDRVLDAYRRSVIDIEQLEEQITRSKTEAEPLHDELMDLIANEIDTGITVGDLANTEDLLRTLRDTIDGDLGWDTRRAVVEGLVSGINVETSGTGHKKIAAVTVSYNFSEPNCVVNSASSC
jgi:site-specific DNA recombinase